MTGRTGRTEPNGDPAQRRLPTASQLIDIGQNHPCGYRLILVYYDITLELNTTTPPPWTSMKTTDSPGEPYASVYFLLDISDADKSRPSRDFARASRNGFWC